jgi:intracellular septation protein A
MSWNHVRSMVRHMIPGFVLPAIIYFLLRPQVGTMVALAVAASVPVVEAVIRAARGRSQNGMALVFLPSTAIGIGLAAILHSPVFILARGGVTTAALGLALALSAVLGRPLTRTIALHLSCEHREARHRLAERWRHPKAQSVFRMLAVAWGLLLLALGGQQILLAMSASPGVFLLVEPPVRAVVTLLGIAGSVLYVRRIQGDHPEIGLLPKRQPATP